MKDKMIAQLGLQVTAMENGEVTVEAAVQENFFNRYGMAHGGYLYTFGHLAAQLSAMTLLGGEWEVRDASCMYLMPLRSQKAKAKCLLRDADPIAPAVAVAVYDDRDRLCFDLNVTLRTATVPQVTVTQTPTILSAEPMPKDPDVVPPFPCLGTTFTRYYNIYSVEIRSDCLVYAADLCETNCDAYGRVHPCVLFTAADSAAGGSMVRIERKQPLTVTASIHYMGHTTQGLVSAVCKPVRRAKAMTYYNVDLIDGAGQCVAFAQFAMQNLA